MPDQSLPLDAASEEPRRRRAGPPARATAAELREVVERAARVPDGFALLTGAPLECVAVLLGVSPRVVERVRLALEDPPSLADARAHFAAATAPRPAPPTAAPRAATPRDPEQLLAAATQRPDGLTLLLSAAAESAAVVFGVHPDLVHGAREVAARRGLSHAPPDV